MELILGIDDAGRGPVIGPMILAGCLLDKKLERELEILGVKDSKQLTAKRREHLAELIREKVEAFEVVVIFPKEIDGDGGERIKLNEVEAIACAKIIDKLNKGSDKIRVIVDCPSTSIAKWTDYLKTKVKNLSNLEISCEHKADQNHISVSAASILAKSERERQMDKLKKKYGIVDADLVVEETDETVETDEEETVVDKKVSAKVNMQRYKGLGEMNPSQLWETTMNPATRLMKQVTIEEAAQADQTFEILMGSEVGPRKKFIQTHAKSVKNLDI